MDPAQPVNDGVVTPQHGRAVLSNHPSTAYYLGYRYTRSWSSALRIYYRCSVRRSTECRGAMVFSVVTLGYRVTRAHTCRDGEARVGLVDVTAQMQAFVDSEALTDLSVSPAAIWGLVRERFYGNDQVNVVQGLSQTQVISRVYRIRRASFGGDLYSMIEMPPMSLVRGTDIPFFQFHYVTPGAVPATSRPNRVIGWAHPALLNLLRYHGVTLFIDGTFRCVPRGFAQCLVIMVHDAASGLFVPACFVLTTNRTEDSYFDAIQFVINATDGQLQPAEVVCDFEVALISAIQTHFPNAEIVGCMFHFKQAVVRRMRHLRIPRREIACAMEPGTLDQLTVLDPSRIESHGIPWVAAQIRRECRLAGIRYSALKWSAFWVYFRSTWLGRYDPAVWNVHGLDNHLIARTNNPLERFNREMNAAFATPHPSMAVFVGAINDIAVGYANRLADIPRGRARRVLRETIRLPRAVEFTDEPFVASDAEDDDNSSLALTDSGVPSRPPSTAIPDISDASDVDHGFEYDGTPERSPASSVAHSASTDFSGDQTD